MDRDHRTKELTNLKNALAHFEHQLDLFEARAGFQPTESQAPDLVPADQQIACAMESFLIVGEAPLFA
jgi:hypothetical protein